MGKAVHDLHSPLTAAMGFANDFRAGGGRKRKGGIFTNYSPGEAERCVVIINDLLDVSAIENGKFEINLSPANLKELIEKRIKLHRFSAQAKEIKIAENLQGFPDLKFDKNRIAQVLDNLFGNAIKFSEPGTTVEVSLDENGKHAIINIKDQGLEFQQKEINKVFGEFQKLSNKPTAGEKSTGLGMAIVKKIVDGHKGMIRVESEIGKGTVFIVSLPMNSKGVQSG